MTDFSDAKCDAFTQTLTRTLNLGALNLALGLGYRLGLFQALSRLGGPRPAAEVADAAGLDRRYVREWLGVMTSAGVVECQKGEGGEETFFLPPEHQAPLLGTHGRGNMGVYTQEIPLLTSLVHEDVADGFRTGRGVPYQRYPTFQAFMTELADAKHRDLLIDRFIPSVDNGRLVERLEAGIRVMDLGCGEGVAATLMAEAFPRCVIVGIDFSEPAIETARRRAGEKGLNNVEFQTRDAARLAEEPDLAESFDYVFAFDAIHDQTEPGRALAGVHHALAPSGLFSMVDIKAESDLGENRDHPMGPFLYAVSLMHCLPVGLGADGRGAGLGMMWGRREALEMMRAAGFDSVEIEAMPYDPFNDHYLARKG